MTAQAPPQHHLFPRGRRVVFVFGIVLLVVDVVVVLLLWLHQRHVESTVRGERTDVVAKGPKLSVVRVELAGGARKITLPAETRGFEQATLYARVAGYAREIRVDRGQRVKKDDVLATIESPETEQALASARSQALLEQQTAQRTRALGGPGVVSKQDVENAVTAERVAQSNLAGAEALRGYANVRAPYDGVVTARYVDPGALLQPSTPLVDVAQIETLRIFLYVGQDGAAFVHEGDAVELWQDELPQTRIPATIAFTTNALDPRTRTMQCEIDLDNRAWRVLPGTFLRAELVLRSPPQPTIPNEALIVRDGKTLAAVVDGDRVRLVEIGVGTSDAKTTRVTRGLAGGETVGVDVPVEVGDGTVVQPIPAKE